MAKIKIPSFNHNYIFQGSKNEVQIKLRFVQQIYASADNELLFFKYISMYANMNKLHKIKRKYF